MPEVCTKITRSNLCLFHKYAELPENSKYVMNFLGEVTQFYSKDCNNKGYKRLGKYEIGLRCKSCQKYLKSSAVKLLRHRLKKRADLFRGITEIQYKTYMMESDVKDVHNFIKTDPKTLSCVGNILFKSERTILIYIVS